VDGDLIGGPVRPGGGTRLYLSGVAAGEVAALFAATDLEAVNLGDDVTAASALKMCYGAWTKGTSALLLTIRAAAAAYGVEEALVTEWARTQPDLAARTQAAAGTAQGVAVRGRDGPGRGLLRRGRPPRWLRPRRRRAVPPAGSRQGTAGRPAPL
jgi:hypothetical protein